MLGRRQSIVAAVCSLTVIAVAASAAANVHESGDRPGVRLVPLDLGVFSRAQTPEEVDASRSSRIAVEAKIVSGSDLSIPETMRPGIADMSELRVPLDDLGPAARSLYLVRTAKGRICAGVTNFSGGCYEGLPEGRSLDVTYGEGYVGEGVIVWGITRDDVESVDVILDGTPVAAIMGQNSYFFQKATSRSAELSAVVAHMRDGSSQTIPIDGPAE